MVTLQETDEHHSCVPYLGSYMHLITVIYEQNEDNSDVSLINFGKLQLISRIIQRIENFKSRPLYKIYPVENIQEYLHHVFILGEDELLKESYRCESPPGSKK